MTSNDDAPDPRRYWATQMDAAYEFMQTIRKYEPNECGESFGSLTEASSDARVEVNFSTKKHVDGLDRQYYLRTGLIRPFIAAAREMNDCGWVMIVEDAFRNRQMQSRLSLEPTLFEQVLNRCRWECQSDSMSAEFVSKRLASLIASCPAVGTHMSGSAIDISVLDRNTGKPIDRGGPYLELSELTPMTSPFVSEEARKNRAEVTDLMRRHGFIAYPWEFWHYNSGDAYAARFTNGAQKAKYGPVDWDPISNTVTPIADATKLLNSLDAIQAAIDAAMARPIKNVPLGLT